MTKKELSVMDLVEHVGLRRRVTHFIKLCRLVASKVINDFHKSGYIAEARNILRAIFGRAPKSDFRVLSLRVDFALLLCCAEALLKHQKPPVKVAWATIHVSRVV